MSGSQQQARVHILTRQGCCLCDDAIAVAREICAQLDVALTTEDVDDAPALRERWNAHVPVTFVDGERFAIWVLDPDGLRQRLQA